jgi:hypothetical protein
VNLRQYQDNLKPMPAHCALSRHCQQSAVANCRVFRSLMKGLTTLSAQGEAEPEWDSGMRCYPNTPKWWCFGSGTAPSFLVAAAPFRTDRNVLSASWNLSSRRNVWPLRSSSRAESSAAHTLGSNEQLQCPDLNAESSSAILVRHYTFEIIARAAGLAQRSTCENPSPTWGDC